MLMKYLDHCYPTAPADEQAAFSDLLEQTDADLQDLLLGSASAENKITARVVSQIRTSRLD